jgi:hypothetical protein
LHDYYSTHGTAVGSNGQNQKEVRRKETWILTFEPGTRNRFGEITIHSSSLTTKIEFPNYAAVHPRYVENLRAFVKRCKEAAEESKEEVLAVERLGLDSEPATQAPSEAQTTGERLIRYNDKELVVQAMDGELDTDVDDEVEVEARTPEESRKANLKHRITRSQARLLREIQDHKRDVELLELEATKTHDAVSFPFIVFQIFDLITK